MKIKDLLKNIDTENISGDINIEVKDICIDNRKCTQGDAFICIKGFSTDGHKYADGAIKNGAAAVFVQNEEKYSELSGRAEKESFCVVKVS
ncbi:MAG: UDP-N-acetylmuramoyl-L-alanyl-D-glutamate--2,6-diaminopimelate ligase, partial [Clostridia bacterium]|nr:UDP-N-acetylmuramoyl-L-alanyl-D-glutamate--2,6-diaminopimelate ligase [Clostridia bacterium]